MLLVCDHTIQTRQKRHFVEKIKGRRRKIMKINNHLIVSYAVRETAIIYIMRTHGRINCGVSISQICAMLLSIETEFFSNVSIAGDFGGSGSIRAFLRSLRYMSSGAI